MKLCIFLVGAILGTILGMHLPKLWEDTTFISCEFIKKNPTSIWLVVAPHINSFNKQQLQNCKCPTEKPCWK